MLTGYQSIAEDVGYTWCANSGADMLLLSSLPSLLKNFFSSFLCIKADKVKFIRKVLYHLLYMLPTKGGHQEAINPMCVWYLNLGP